MLNVILVLYTIAIACGYQYAFSRSIIGMSTRHSNYLGIGMVLNMFVFILPGMVLILLLGVEEFWALFRILDSESAGATGLLLVLLAMLLVAFLWLGKTVFRRYVFLGFDPFRNARIGRLQNLAMMISVWMLAVYLFIVVVFDYRHAIISSIFAGQSLSAMRYGNAASSAPSFIIYFFIVNSYFLAAISGLLSSKRKYMYLVVAVLSASVSGHKMPVLATFLIFICTYSTYKLIRLTPGVVVKGFIYSFLFSLLIFFLVSLQYNYGFDTFLDYLLNRAGIGAIAGFYEQYHLRLQDFDYFWHSVPFYNFVAEGQNFHKDLMIISEGRISGKNIGIKNTLPFAEAYAIGGALLMFLSPLIYAFNYLLSIVVISKLVCKIYLLDARATTALVGIVFVMFIQLTGGFSDLFLFKAPILFFLCLLGPLVSCGILYGTSQHSRANRLRVAR